MNTKMNLIVALVGSAALVLGGCEEKKGTDATKAVTGAVKDAGKSVADTAKKGTEAVKDAGKAAVDTAKDAGKAAADKAAETTKKAGEAVKDGADKAKDAAKEGMDKAKDMAGDMMAKAKDWGSGYSDQLSALAGKLEGIKTKDDATKALPEIKPIMDKVNGFVENLNKLPADTKTKLLGDWKEKLAPITSKFQGQIDRLMKDDGIKSVLGDTFKNFKLFN